MPISHCLRRIGGPIRSPASGIPGQVPERQMRRIQHALEIHIQNFKIWGQGLSGIDIFWVLKRLLWVHDACIRDHGVDAAMRGHLDYVLEEGDLGLPVGDIAVEEMEVLVARLFLDISDLLGAFLHVNVADNNVRACCCPAAEEAGAEAGGAAGDEDGLIFEEGGVGYGCGELGGGERRGLANFVDDGIGGG